MKVKFNKPSRRYTNKFQFDNNTTFGIGNVQPLFCKQLCAGSKISVTFNQLTRLSPLVVPSFARLKQRNDFVFVPMAMVMPSFDAFLSRSLINGTEASYVPQSVPCITNSDLFISLVKHYSSAAFIVNGSYNKTDDISIKSTYGNVTITNVFKNAQTVPSPSTDLPTTYYDFVLNNRSSVNPGTWGSTDLYCFKLTTAGRFWLSVLRGLGYTLDPNDLMPVSILPLWAFAKAYYDVYYPKRYSPWHASNYYSAINKYYNGKSDTRNIGGLYYDLVDGFDQLYSLFGPSYSFDFFASIDDSLVTVATDNPINSSSSAGTQLKVFDNSQYSEDSSYQGSRLASTPSATPDLVYLGSNVPSVDHPMANGKTNGITADQLRLVDRLWSFVQKSSVVGQSVKDWFAVHLGVKTNEDMFDQTTLVESIVNDVSINTVVSTAQTSDGARGDNLGALAGQGYAAKNGGVHFEAKTFGFFMCLTSLIPVSGVSCGTQPELYQNTLYEQQLPDFDALGYEVLNKSSFTESIVKGNQAKFGTVVAGGFGYVPRLSSWKCMHNIRSGNFAVNSVKDSLLPYNVDVLPLKDMTSGTIWRFPWALNGNFMSFNRMFYNVEPEVERGFGASMPPAPLDDNFMCQTSFDVSYTSYLKPLSDSYSIESLGKDLVSVKEQ